MAWWIDALIGAGAAVLLIWVALLTALLLLRPSKAVLVEAARLLPDVLRLLTRLARDRSLPRSVRMRLWLLLGYLALPIDIVPDFIPIIGYADDAIIITAVLRSVVRSVGTEPVARHWPGTDDGFTVLQRLTGLDKAQPPGCAATRRR